MSSVDLIPGAQVRARGLRWEVVRTEPLREQLLVRLRALDGSLRGEEFDLLYPFESIERVSKDFDTAKPAPLRSWWVYHQAFLLVQTLGRNALSMLQPGKLKLEPYQLVPVLRAVQSRRPRLLLADGVGLGKTIQAGLILIELIARRLAHRVLIVSPPGPLLEQWCVELSQRFGIQPTVLDRAKLEEIKRTAELGANPFDFVSLGVASIDFLKQEKILQLLERTSYDLVIIDEAHHCFDPGGDSNREDSQRRKLAEVLARKSDALLLLTATPHDGNDRSLASLCELLDPSLVDGRRMLRKNFYQKHVIRRLKRHIKDPETNQPLFKEREVIPVKVGVTLKERPAFEKLHREFLEFISPQL